MRSGLAAFADEQGWVLADAGEDGVGEKQLWMGSKTGLNVRAGFEQHRHVLLTQVLLQEPVHMTWLRHWEQVVKEVKACAQCLSLSQPGGVPALLPSSTSETNLHQGYMVTEQTLSKRQNTFVVRTAMIEEEHRGTERLNDLWKVVWHPVTDAWKKKADTHMYVLPGMFLWLAVPPSPPCLFCSAPSQAHFLFWLPTTGFFPFPLFFVFHNLCKAQLMHSKAVTEQESHDVGCKEARWFHPTPHVTVKCCCCFASESVNHHCEGLDDNLRDLNHTEEERWKI